MTNFSVCYYSNKKGKSAGTINLLNQEERFLSNEYKEKIRSNIIRRENEKKEANKWEEKNKKRKSTILIMST